MKAQIEQLLHAALVQLQNNGLLTKDITLNIQLTRTKDASHGDFATNIALMLGKATGVPPRTLAENILKALPASTLMQKAEIAGPGFINFFLNKTTAHEIINTVLQKGTAYGQSTLGANKKILIEFVSANPTGPLHVGHGRGAAYGATLSNLLAVAGFQVDREYYVNDAGRQMNILATSVWLRYLELHKITLAFPVNGYRGSYIYEIAQSLKDRYGAQFTQETAIVLKDLPLDETDGGDKEIYIDALSQRCLTLLGDDQYRLVFDCSLNAILDDIRDDLQEFGVEYNIWFSERALTESGALEACLQKLEQSAHLYRKEGALWFKSTDFGDEKDRVIQRENGQTTYFASDIAYHLNKFERGYERIIDIWGADHHGYIPRVRAAIEVMTGDASRFEVLLVQFANLYRGHERISMSTRSGEFVTLRTLRDEVGNDAARFYYVMRRCEQHMDFDLQLAKSQSRDNPVYYVQYAHARIANVFSKLTELKLIYDQTAAQQHLALLTDEHEQKLMQTLSRYPEVIEIAAKNAEPHLVIFYLRDLATDLHKYYDTQKILLDDANLRNARLSLAKATQQVLQNALRIVGVSAPTHM